MKIYATAAKIYAPLTNTLCHPYFFMEYGYALSQTGQHEESIAILQRVAQILPDPQIYNRIGKSYQALGEYQLAEQYFQKAHHMVPNLVYPNFLLAQLYLEMGLRDKTLECARQILTLKPKKESEETLHIKAQMEQLIQRLD
ncbi:tetratricopeptide repeat protein [Butyricimonas virosa]|jgi:tetratricopeptide (TPR) repeat protein|uniref:tetratricopeptide repeat protein n=3 Tax=Butyricimonas virosa TaxID=544645 RepID=UPI00241D65CB|nr:tetratricopeptide repeat protein [Butyricimonas virosa]